MENFFYNDNFYNDLTELAEYLEEDVILELDDDFAIQVETSKREPIVIIDANWIIDHIDEERFSEDPDKTIAQMKRVFIECIDFEKLNSKMPTMQYGTGKMSIVTKEELLDSL